MADGDRRISPRNGKEQVWCSGAWRSLECNWFNLQPLWAADNLKKGCR